MRSIRTTSRPSVPSAIRAGSIKLRSWRSRCSRRFLPSALGEDAAFGRIIPGMNPGDLHRPTRAFFVRAPTAPAGISVRLGCLFPASPLPREIAVDHPVVISLAPSPSTARTRSAPLLEAHLGAVVGAVAGVIGEGIEECRDGGLTPKTKSQSAEFLCELVRLREFMI